MDKKFCFDALAEEGFQPEIDEDGDISFLATPELFRSNLRRYVELLLDMQESVFDACGEDEEEE